MLKYYVYLYRDQNDIPFYIGKGCGRRYKFGNHLRKDNSFLYNKINKLTPSNIEIHFLYTSDDEAKIYEMEEHTIRKIGCRFDNTGPLCNLTKDRGTFMSGYKPSDETRKKLSRAKIGKNNHQCGQPRSKEIKLKIAEALKGKKPSGARTFYVLKNNIIIAEYTNKYQCARDFNLFKEGISNCLKQKQQIHAGYTFQYVEDYNEPDI